MIKHLVIENFKKFQRIELNLKDMTVLMGENGCGKTSILQAIALALRLISTTDLFQCESNSNRIRFRKKGVPYTQLPGFFVEDPADLFFAKQMRGGQKAGVTSIKIEITDRSDNVYKINITSLFGAYTAKVSSKANDFVSYPSLIDIEPLFISGFVGIQSSEERLFPLALQDRLTRGRVSEVLRNLIFDIYEKDEEKFKRLYEKVKKHFNFEIGNVNFQSEKDLFVHAEFNERVGSKTINLDLSSAGSGFLQVLQILTPIYRFSEKSKVILLDEPDAHLHPNLQRTIARVIKEICEEEDLQVILSTHSTAIIRETSPESIVPVSAKKIKLGYLNSSNDIEAEITARIDNFFSAKASIIGKVLFVEDKNKKILKYIDQIMGINLFEGLHSLPVLSTQGKDDKIPFRIKTSLEEITGENIDVYFIRDSDGLPQQWQTEIIKHAKESNVNLFLLPFHEIENILLKPAIVQRYLKNNHGFHMKISEIESLIIKMSKNILSMSKFGFERTLRDNFYKAAKILNKDGYSYQSAESDALKLRNNYEAIDDFDQLVKVVPGKEAVKELLFSIKRETGIPISMNNLICSVQLSDIESTLKEFLQNVRQL